MLVVGPGIPAELKPFCLSVVEAIQALQVPLSPTPIFACATADMPPAADWPDHVLRNETLNILAVSDGVNWLRQDTGAVI